MNCYVVGFHVFPYRELQYMLTFAPDEQTAITQVRDLLWKKRILITPEGAELDMSPVWDNRRQHRSPVRVRRRAVR